MKRFRMEKIEIVCVIIVVAFMSLLIGIYYQSRTRGKCPSLCSGWYQMKDGRGLNLNCLVCDCGYG